jgi:hypothetical protein
LKNLLQQWFCIENRQKQYCSQSDFFQEPARFPPEPGKRLSVPPQEEKDQTGKRDIPKDYGNRHDSKPEAFLAKRQKGKHHGGYDQKKENGKFKKLFFSPARFRLIHGRTSRG